MTSTKEILISAIEGRLVPFLLGKGFEQPAQISESDDEVRAVFPFRVMCRRKGDDVEAIEIQLDKRGRARFVVNFGIIPSGGVILPWGRMHQHEAQVSDLPEYYRLYSRPGSIDWFSGSILDWLRGAHYSAEQSVDAAIQLYSEIEDWFGCRKIGPHVKRTGYPVGRPAASQAGIDQR